MKEPNENLLNYSLQHGAPYRGSTRFFPKRGKPEEHEQNDLASINMAMDSYLAMGDLDEPKPSDPMYIAWRKTVDAVGPYSNLFTLSFRCAYSDAEAISALKGWCSMMNRCLKGPRWKLKGTGLVGTAFAERHSISLSYRGRLHFHVLLARYETILPTEILRSIAEACALKLKDSRGRRMTDLARVDMRDVPRQDRLVGYLLKDINTQHWTAGDNIAFLTPDQGLGDFPMERLSANKLRQLH